MLKGMQITPSFALTETKEVHRQERKWAHRVMYRREQRFRITYGQVPSDRVIIAGDRVFAHPAMIGRIKEAIDQATGWQGRKP